MIKDHLRITHDYFKIIQDYFKESASTQLKLLSLALLSSSSCTTFVSFNLPLMKKKNLKKRNFEFHRVQNYPCLTRTRAQARFTLPLGTEKQAGAEVVPSSSSVKVEVC